MDRQEQDKVYHLDLAKLINSSVQDFKLSLCLLTLYRYL